MSSDQPNQRPLGRGLNSLIPKRDPNTPNFGSGSNINRNFGAMTGRDKAAASYFPKTMGKEYNQILHIAPDKIQVNPYQPRKEFASKPLAELKESIRVHGIIQPLLVTATLGGGYELVAGERRLRAAKELGLKKVPVVVRSARELEKLELSLIENIQRQDLNAVEKAQAYRRLIDNFGLTHEEAAKRLGVSRPVVSNALRLLNLPADIQMDIAAGKISEGQAKVMLEVKDQHKQQLIHQKAKEADLTVRDVEREVRKVKTSAKKRKTKKNPQLVEWEEQMQSVLGTKVCVRQRGKRGGVIEIEFYSEEELVKIVEAITSS